MKANVGTVDRAVRLLAGLLLAGCGLFGGIAAPWNYVAMGFGVVLLFTAAFRFCPAYSILGANTRGGTNDQDR